MQSAVKLGSLRRVDRAAERVARLERDLDVANLALDDAMSQARDAGWSLRVIADATGLFPNVTVHNRTRRAA